MHHKQKVITKFVLKSTWYTVREKMVQCGSITMFVRLCNGCFKSFSFF